MGCDLEDNVVLYISTQTYAVAILDLPSYNPDHIIVEFVFYPLLETRLQLSGAMHNLLHFNFFS
jgi:hypothetical protein